MATLASAIPEEFRATGGIAPVPSHRFEHKIPPSRVFVAFVIQLFQQNRITLREPLKEGFVGGFEHWRISDRRLLHRKILLEFIFQEAEELNAQLGTGWFGQ